MQAIGRGPSSRGRAIERGVVMLYYPFMFLSTNLMAFISIMLSLLVGMMALYLYNSGAFTRTARKL
jgi:E3 ubiquitin-protein ligase DOA10